MIKFLPLDIFLIWYFRCVSQRILWKNETSLYRLQIPELVLEIFKFEKCVKCVDEMTDDVIHCTRYYIVYRYVWIYENGVKKWNSHFKRAFFSPKSTIQKLQAKSVLFSFLCMFISLSIPSFLYYLPVFRA